MDDRTPNAHRRRFCTPLSWSSARRGFTLIELLIALVLLDVGLLALVGTGAAIARGASGARAAARATSLASARLERAASVPCRRDGSGTAVSRDGVSESWTETTGANGTRVVTDSATFATAVGVGAIVLRMGARC